MKINWKHGWIIACLFWFQAMTPIGGFGADIEIKGASKFQNAVSNALFLLKIKAPDTYEIVTNNIAIIDESEHSGMEAMHCPANVRPQ